MRQGKCGNGMGKLTFPVIGKEWTKEEKIVGRRKKKKETIEQNQQSPTTIVQM